MMKQLIDALDYAADGAFIVDENQQIYFWNKSAEKILGFRREDVDNQFCYQILHGNNEEKHLICKARCQVALEALQTKPVPNFDLHVRTKNGEEQWINMSVFTYSIGEGEQQKVIVHLFHDLSDKKLDERILGQLLDVVRRYQGDPPSTSNGTKVVNHVDALTSRESEILALLARGCSTSEISQLLSISTNTVRNHIQHILQKLQVHTRLEAVTYAIKHNLIT